MKKKAFVTGICGQDGYYLTRLLTGQGYRVFGTDTTAATRSCEDEEIYGMVSFLSLDLTDPVQTSEMIREHRFDEIYNLAAISFIPASWDNPSDNMRVNAGIPLNLLEGIRKHSPDTRIFQACSSELFGDCGVTPQNEDTPFHPRSPYSANKIHAYHMMKTYREQRGLFTVNGILYNHESPHRPSAFVTRKITRSAAAIKLGLQDHLELGDLEAVRDWSFAGDIVRAMHLTLTHDHADDYIIGSGQSRSVREFCEAAFSALDLDYRKYVTVNPGLVRKEKSVLRANPEKIRREVGWQPETDFNTLVGMMVEKDLDTLRE